jgi:opacity protein-like surface antigen
MKKSLAGVILLFCLSYAAHADEAAEKAATAAAQAWLAQIDSGSHATSWKEASGYFRGASTEKSWVDALNGVRKPLGKLVSRKLTKAQNAQSLPGAPDGNYVVMQFDTSFANKKDAVETVTFMREKDGKWKAAGYYIK